MKQIVMDNLTGSYMAAILTGEVYQCVSLEGTETVVRSKDSVTVIDGAVVKV